jgi:hypothetical protein
LVTFQQTFQFLGSFFTSFLQKFQFWGSFFFDQPSTKEISQLTLNPVWDVGLTMNPKKDPKKTKKTKNMGKSAF